METRFQAAFGSLEAVWVVAGRTAGLWGKPSGVVSEAPKTTRFTVFLRFGAQKTVRFTALLRLRVHWGVGVRATGHWGEPPGVVSEAPTRALERGRARDRPLGRAAGSGVRGASKVPRAVPHARNLAGFSAQRDDAGNIAPRKRRARVRERPRWAHLARIAPKMGQHSAQDGAKMGPDGGSSLRDGAT